MPRDGSGTYSIPLGTDGVPDQTIESTKYNGFAHDLEQDNNIPRPIVAGGTGATSARNALTNLQAEISGEQVTNYDTHPFINGSFYSYGTATGGLFGGVAFAGICYKVTDTNIILEARALQETPPGRVYVREKDTTWGPWTSDIRTAGVIKLNTTTPSVWNIDNITANLRFYDEGGHLWMNIASSDGKVTLTSTTPSSSPTTGALTVAGGLGVAAGIFVGPAVAMPWPLRISVSYHGSTTFGIGFRPQVDGGYPCLFANAAGAGVGSISTTSSATAFNTSSDARLKQDFRPVNAGPVIDALQVHDFAWKVGGRAHGVVAQEAAEVYPQAVTYDEANDGWFTDYSKFVPLLLAELKALRARVAELEGRLTVKPA